MDLFVYHMEQGDIMKINIKEKKAISKFYLVLQLGAIEALKHDVLDIEVFSKEWFNLKSLQLLIDLDIEQEIIDLFKYGMKLKDISKSNPEALPEHIEFFKTHTIEMLKLIDQSGYNPVKWLVHYIPANECTTE